MQMIFQLLHTNTYLWSRLNSKKRGLLQKLLSDPFVIPIEAAMTVLCQEFVTCSTNKWFLWSGNEKFFVVYPQKVQRGKLDETEKRVGERTGWNELREWVGRRDRAVTKDVREEGTTPKVGFYRRVLPDANCKCSEEPDNRIISQTVLSPVAISNICAILETSSYGIDGELLPK